MGSRPRELISHYLAGRISEDELAKSLAAELRAEHEQTASDLAGRLLAILGRHRTGHLSEADVRLAVLPEASWAYRDTMKPASAPRPGSPAIGSYAGGATGSASVIQSCRPPR